MGAGKITRIEKYVLVPVNLDTASDEGILSIPGVGRHIVREFREYRPYTNIEQFCLEIGKCVDKNEVLSGTVSYGRMRMTPQFR